MGILFSRTCILVYWKCDVWVLWFDMLFSEYINRIGLALDLMIYASFYRCPTPIKYKEQK